MLQIEIIVIQITFGTFGKTYNLVHFNKILTSKSFKIQNDVLTKETVKANSIKTVSAMSGIIGTLFMVYNHMNPDTTVKTAGLVAPGANYIFVRTKSLFIHGYGDDDKDKEKDEEVGDQRRFFADKKCPSYKNQQSPINTDKYKLNRKDKAGQGWTPFTDKYMNKKTQKNKNNRKFRNKIINFVGDKAGLSNEQIIDKRYK